MTFEDYTVRILCPMLERWREKKKAEMLAEGWLLCRGAKRGPYWRRGLKWKEKPSFLGLKFAETRPLRIRLPDHYVVEMPKKGT